MYRLFNLRSSSLHVADFSDQNTSVLSTDTIASSALLELVYRECHTAVAYGVDPNSITFNHIFIHGVCPRTKLILEEYHFDKNRLAITNSNNDIYMPAQSGPVNLLLKKITSLLHGPNPYTKNINQKQYFNVMTPDKVINISEKIKPQNNTETKNIIKPQNNAEEKKNNNFKEVMKKLLAESASDLQSMNSKNIVEDRKIITMPDPEEENKKLRNKHKQNWKNPKKKNNMGMDIDDNDNNKSEDDMINLDDDMSITSNSESNNTDGSSTTFYDSDEDKEDNDNEEEFDMSDIDSDDDEETREIKEAFFTINKKKKNLKKEIKTQSKKLDDDLTNYYRYFDSVGDDKRTIRLMKEREEERIRVFASDKRTFSLLVDKIIASDGKFNENHPHFPPMMKHKWPILKFMAEKELLNKFNDYDIFRLLFNEIHHPVSDKEMVKNEKAEFFNTHALNYKENTEIKVFDELKIKYKSVVDEFIKQYKEDHIKFEPVNDVLAKLKKQAEEAGYDIDESDNDDMTNDDDSVNEEDITNDNDDEITNDNEDEMTNEEVN